MIVVSIAYLQLPAVVAALEYYSNDDWVLKSTLPIRMYVSYAKQVAWIFERTPRPSLRPTTVGRQMPRATAPPAQFYIACFSQRPVDATAADPITDGSRRGRLRDGTE